MMCPTCQTPCEPWHALCPTCFCLVNDPDLAYACLQLRRAIIKACEDKYKIKEIDIEL